MQSKADFATIKRRCVTNDENRSKLRRTHTSPPNDFMYIIKKAKEDGRYTTVRVCVCAEEYFIQVAVKETACVCMSLVRTYK